MTELALVVMTFALVLAAFALGFITGARYIPKKAREAWRIALKDADLTDEQRAKLSVAIELAASQVVSGASR